MRESIGSIALYNFIIIYIILVFAILSAMISYNKAFKINSRIIGSIEKYEGWNEGAQKEADRYLGSFGYRERDRYFRCPENNDERTNLGNGSVYQYCVYYDETEDPKETGYYRYSVVTYIYADLPIVGNFSLPIWGKSNRIYKFTDSQEIQKR